MSTSACAGAVPAAVGTARGSGEVTSRGYHNDCARLPDEHIASLAPEPARTVYI
jgi:hypothetical protein